MTTLARRTAPTEEPRPELKAWAIVELFGHQRLVGLVTVDPVEFPGMVRVDVPDLLKDGKVIRRGLTRYVGKAALYGVTPVTEETVRQLLPTVDGAPTQPYSFNRSVSEEDL